MNIEMGKKYQTRDGRAVRILATDRAFSKFPVVGLVRNHAGDEQMQAWDATGFQPYLENASLIPVPTKHEAEMRWSPQDRIPVVQLSNGNIVNLTCFLDLLAEGTATKALVTWES